MERQDQLVLSTHGDGRNLVFDFPNLHIGTAEYPQGPTGATVFWFPKKAVAAVDVRGGAPGSYNLDWLRQGYDFPSLDAIVVSGGSWYGLGTAAGVSAALKDRSHRSGHWSNLATVAGAIIYDFGTRRLTPYHPDERLGRAALEAAVPGVFPLGARGAGRNAMQGSYFGLWLHSGQGGAFQQVGTTKIAAFSIVNSVGAVVDRMSNVATGGQWVPEDSRRIGDLINLVPGSIRSQAGSILGLRQGHGNPANTTISAVITNQKLTYAELQRLAVQVHTSMGRMIQPLATANDGDILFAVSTGEEEASSLHPTDLGVVASEVMWSAVLNSVPDLDVVFEDTAEPLKDEDLRGRFQFAPEISLDVNARDNRVEFTPQANRELFGIEPGVTVQAKRRTGNTFVIDQMLLHAVRFERNVAGEVTLILNPGQWQQVGTRVSGS